MAHRHTFTYGPEDFVFEVCPASGGTSRAASRFDRTLRSTWADKMSRGLFRYRLGDLETKVLPGELGYVAQLNIKRGTERRKPQDVASIRQSFDPRLFNFNKIHPEELLFDVRKVEPDGTAEVACAAILNVSPLEFGHCLLVPEPMRCHPQILTPRAVRVGIESVFLSADPGYRVGFNSLGAFASVNHLHLHGYYLDHALRIEWAPAELIAPDKGLYRLRFPNGFVFYTDGRDLHATVANICKVTDVLVERNIAHNVFITRGCPPDSDGVPSAQRHGVRVLVWPRVASFGAKEESAFNVALCELAGHLPFKNRQDFESFTEGEVKAMVQKFVLNDEEFVELQKQIVEIF
ncbi:GDP-D-glucose phosphorylase 1 [Electrophorus electricus]|uniref:GDP-D-glucose phosphorylase 1 n=1 Tax=Electrophorus electricus TaxID=8005 RepID=A0A4W4HBX1_ELEEL|nr:GDP-D-glucose phosphorylase 1 [Electrophorus electricus]